MRIVHVSGKPDFLNKRNEHRFLYCLQWKVTIKRSYKKMAKKICSLGWTKTTIEEIQRIRSIQKMIDNKAFQSQGRGQPQSQLYILLYCRQQAFKYKVV